MFHLDLVVDLNNSKALLPNDHAWKLFSSQTKIANAKSKVRVDTDAYCTQDHEHSGFCQPHKLVQLPVTRTWSAIHPTLPTLLDVIRRINLTFGKTFRNPTCLTFQHCSLDPPYILKPSNKTILTMSGKIHNRIHQINNKIHQPPFDTGGSLQYPYSQLYHLFWLQYHHSPIWK